MKKLASLLLPLLALIMLFCCACESSKIENDPEVIATEAPALSEDASAEPAVTPTPTPRPTAEPTPEPTDEPTDEEIVLELAWERVEKFNLLYNLKFTKDMAADNIMVNKEYYVGDERGAEVSFYDTESELLAKFNFKMLSYEGVWEYDDCFITMYGFDPLGEHYDREKLDSDLEALLLEEFTGEVTADTLEAEGYPATEGGAEQYVKGLIARSFTDCPEDNYFHCSEGLALLKERFGNTNVVILLHPDDIAPITTDNRIGSNGFYIEENNYSWYSFPEVRSEYWGYFMLRRNVEITRNGDTFAYSVIDPFGKW